MLLFRGRASVCSATPVLVWVCDAGLPGKARAFDAAVVRAEDSVVNPGDIAGSTPGDISGINPAGTAGVIAAVIPAVKPMNDQVASSSSMPSRCALNEGNFNDVEGGWGAGKFIEGIPITGGSKPGQR